MSLFDEPKPWCDHSIIRDRIVINEGVLADWLRDRFQIHTRREAEERLTDIDPLAERVTVDGIDYQIPHECYYSLGMEPGDTRPMKEAG